MPSTLILDIGLLAILVVVAIMIVRLRSLFAIVMLQGVYSLVSAAWFVSLDAVDVAFTEAAVGAGVSTVLMLSAMLLADRESKPVPLSNHLAPLFIVIVAGAAMFYAVGDMPAYGDANSPANTHVGMDFMEMTANDIHIPNVVTAVLGSYRGFDTFGETVVIFAAGLGVLLLLGLNGNAGRWQAVPNGINLTPSEAPPGVPQVVTDKTLQKKPKSKKVKAKSKVAQKANTAQKAKKKTVPSRGASSLSKKEVQSKTRTQSKSRSNSKAETKSKGGAK